MNKTVEDLRFGDYCLIEQKRFGIANELYLHKVIKGLRSNAWVDVPVILPPTEEHHKEMADVILCICCGVQETEVRRYRRSDVKPATIADCPNFMVTE